MEARTRLVAAGGAEGVGSDEPWIRRISNVHAEIARSGKRPGKLNRKDVEFQGRY